MSYLIDAVRLLNQAAMHGGSNGGRLGIHIFNDPGASRCICFGAVVSRWVIGFDIRLRPDSDAHVNRGERREVPGADMDRWLSMPEILPKVDLRRTSSLHFPSLTVLSSLAEAKASKRDLRGGSRVGKSSKPFAVASREGLTNATVWSDLVSCRPLPPISPAQAQLSPRPEQAIYFAIVLQSRVGVAESVIHCKWGQAFEEFAQDKAQSPGEMHRNPAMARLLR